MRRDLDTRSSLIYDDGCVRKTQEAKKRENSRIPNRVVDANRTNQLKEKSTHFDNDVLCPEKNSVFVLYS